VSACSHTCIIARHVDRNGRLREVLTHPGAAGSTLVLDRDVRTRRDLRLIAHLAADEPPVNALLTCREYLRNHRRLCRLLTAEDLVAGPIVQEAIAGELVDDRYGPAVGGDGPVGGETVELLDRYGYAYRLGCTYRLAARVNRSATTARRSSIPIMRWLRYSVGWGCGEQDADVDRSADESGTHAGEHVCVRDVVGAIESYQPVRALTTAALTRCQGRSDISTSILRAELERIDSSRIVLNRGLREAVLAVVSAQGLTMSEITARCGRCKRDTRGNCHGDTSWLARRIGLVPEGGRDRPTPWVHSDVLALIAREGLGISPREVEL
jgi:hypothetical protein